MRINIIPVSELLDQHLVAEYREIKMLPKALVRSIKSKRGLVLSEISNSYTLNKGHGYFFYDKLYYIESRFQELLVEMRRRNFATNMIELYDKKFDYSVIPKSLYGKYTPKESEMDINRERIELRVSEKPSFYKYYGLPVK